MINKAILIGRLGRDPEMRYSQSGMAIANFSIATDTFRNDQSGQRQKTAEWHRIVAFDKLGEICGKYLSKGKLVYIEGRIQTREWNDKENNKRYTTEIVAYIMQMLEPKGSESFQRAYDDDPGPSDADLVGTIPPSQGVVMPPDITGKSAGPSAPESGTDFSEDIPF